MPKSHKPKRKLTTRPPVVFTTRITVRVLKKLGACVEQVDQFRKAHPRGLDVTPEAAVAARDAGFDVEWLLDRISVAPEILTALGWRVYLSNVKLETISHGERIAFYANAKVKTVSGGDVRSCASSQQTIETVSGGYVSSWDSSQQTIETVSGGYVSSWDSSQQTIETDNRK